MTSLRYAFRSLKKSPGFVAIAVVALATGLGLSTTMFAVLDAVTNPYSAFRDGKQLYSIVPFWNDARLTYGEIEQQIRERAPAFESFAEVVYGAAPIEYQGHLERTGGIRVRPEWFSVMGVVPEIGRIFTPADGPDVALVSRGIWERVLGNADIATVTLVIEGRAHTVLGVMPAATGGPVWRPLAPRNDALGPRFPSAIYVARLRQESTREEAQNQLWAIARDLNDRHSLRDAPLGLLVGDVWGVRTREEVRDVHKAMIGAALAVLLISCANLAHLMLARGLGKRRELALRMALGASRGAVVRQLFLECLLVTVVGAALAGVIAVWGADVLRNRMPPDISWIGLLRPQLSWRVFALSGTAAAVSVVMFGLLPAIRVVRAISLDEPIKESSATATARVRHRYSPLVITEVALALVLAMAAGLLIRTVLEIRRQEILAFDARTLYRAEFALDRAVTPEQLRAAAANAPGVLDVATETVQGLVRSGGSLTAELAGDSNRIIPARNYPIVSSTYFRTLGLPILAGRDFAPGDGVGAGVAIIDPVAAQRLYPGDSAVGRMVKLSGANHDGPWVRIIGIVRSPHILESAARLAPEPRVFVSRPATETRHGQLLIRTERRGPAVAAALQARLLQVPGVQVRVRPYDAEREAELTSRSFLAGAFVSMGVVALALATFGLYGVLAYAVSQRLREFAIRMALGARPEMIRDMVLRDGVVMLLAGLGVGAFLALGLARWVDSMLVTVQPSDLVSLLTTEIVLAAVGLTAALGPARRASRANPLDILRAS